MEGCKWGNDCICGEYKILTRLQKKQRDNVLDVLKDHKIQLELLLENYSLHMDLQKDEDKENLEEDEWMTEQDYIDVCKVTQTQWIWINDCIKDIQWCCCTMKIVYPYNEFMDEEQENLENTKNKNWCEEYIIEHLKI
jgi:hypothetical protein